MGRYREEYSALPGGSDSAGPGRAAASFLQQCSLEQEEEAAQTSSSSILNFCPLIPGV